MDNNITRKGHSLIQYAQSLTTPSNSFAALSVPETNNLGGSSDHRGGRDQNNSGSILTNSSSSSPNSSMRNKTMFNKNSNEKDQYNDRGNQKYYIKYKNDF